MQHRNGDLFTTDAKIIAHGANIKGVMGAGVAKTIKEKFPANFKFYKHVCDVGLAVPGEFTGVPDRGVVILNLYTQDNPGANARYEWVFASVMDFFRFYSPTEKAWGTTIAIPEIGSGIGGLEWPKVEQLLLAAEAIYPEFEFEVWHYEG